MKNIVAALCALLLAAQQAGAVVLDASPAEDFFDTLLARDFEKANLALDDKMRLAMGGGKLERLWLEFRTYTGHCREKLPSSVTLQDAYVITVVGCKFDNGKFRIKLATDRTGKISGMYFLPPDTPPYKDPAYAPRREDFREEDVQVGTAPWTLRGTFTAPKGDGPFPVVVFVHGSGPQDRDETIGPNKPFKDMALGLAAMGIASLRYDKRTLVYARETQARAKDFTPIEETVDDAIAAVQKAKRASVADPGKVFIAGHSFGASMAPFIAAKAGGVAGLIMLAPSATPLEDDLVRQITYLARLDDDVSEQEQAAIGKVREQAAMVKSAALSKDTPTDMLPMGIGGSYWLFLRAYDPLKAASDFQGPVMVMRGDRDYQTTKDDFDAYRRLLRKRKNTSFVEFKDLNHLFMKGKGPCDPQEYTVQGSVEEDVIDTMASWVLARK